MNTAYIRLVFPTLIVFIFGCQSGYFKNDLPLILDIERVEVVNFSSKDEFGGLGEGYTFEKYKLSKVTIDEFRGDAQGFFLLRLADGKDMVGVKVLLIVHLKKLFICL